MPVATDHDRTQGDLQRLREEVRRLEGRVSELDRDLREVQRERQWEAIHRSLARERIVLTVVAALACAVILLVGFGTGHL